MKYTDTQSEAVESARTWLTDKYTFIHGHRVEWPEKVTDKYHEQLGFLVDYILETTE
jgi:hypothetical protein